MRNQTPRQLSRREKVKQTGKTVISQYLLPIVCRNILIVRWEMTIRQREMMIVRREIITLHCEIAFNRANAIKKLR